MSERDDPAPDDPAPDDPAPDIIPQTLVGISFPDVYRAQEFLTAVTRLKANRSLVLEDAVIVNKDDEGKTVVRETIDPQPGRSAMSGGLWTGLFGLLLGGPVGWAAGAAIGAGAGALTAKVVDLGISDEWVAWFREAVKPGTATVAILASEIVEDDLVTEVHRFAGADLVYANFDDEMLARLREALLQSPLSDVASSDIGIQETVRQESVSQETVSQDGDEP